MHIYAAHPARFHERNEQLANALLLIPRILPPFSVLGVKV